MQKVFGQYPYNNLGWSDHTSLCAFLLLATATVSFLANLSCILLRNLSTFLNSIWLLSDTCAPSSPPFMLECYTFYPLRYAHNMVTCTGLWLIERHSVSCFESDSLPEGSCSFWVQVRYKLKWTTLANPIGLCYCGFNQFDAFICIYCWKTRSQKVKWMKLSCLCSAFGISRGVLKTDRNICKVIKGWGVLLFL